MGTMQLDGRYHELYVRLAADYRVPVRIAPRLLLERMGMGQVWALADELGVLAPDFLHFHGPPEPEATNAYWTSLFEGLQPGVSEILVHAGCDDPELRACCPAWRQRVADHEFFSAPSTRAQLVSLGIQTIGYRALREAQRAG
jgi:hypothetical protein